MALTLSATSAWAQSKVPPELTGLVHKDLKAGQKEMETLGYEIVYSSFAKKVQYWWNEDSKTCVSLKIKGKEIDGFSTIDTKECESRVAAARKVWDGYHDGPAPVYNPTLDREREKLSGQGYKAS